MLPRWRDDDQHRERGNDHDLPRGRSPSRRPRPGTAPCTSSDASDALCSTPRDDEPHDREADDDQRVQHDERAARGRDALAALAVERERVADDRGDAERERAGAAADRAARRPPRSRPSRSRAASTSAPARQPSEPGDVRRARIARALVQACRGRGPGRRAARSGTSRAARRAGTSSDDRRACAVILPPPWARQSRPHRERSPSAGIPRRRLALALNSSEC